MLASDRHRLLHGDGTQEIFYADADVLTVSLHRFEHALGQFYPPAGLPAHVGTGAGAGRNVNVAFPHAAGGFGDGDYDAVCAHLVLPICRSFDPALLIVAAGFDSARGDPIGGFDLTAHAGFAAMLRGLRGAARRGTKVLVVPEGGYSVEAQAQAVDACVAMLRREEQHEAGDPGPAAAPKVQTAAALAAALRHQAPHWPCLQGWEDAVVAGVRLGDAPRPQGLECAHHAPCWCRQQQQQG